MLHADSLVQTPPQKYTNIFACNTLLDLALQLEHVCLLDYRLYCAGILLAFDP